jgi:hypothetical protein
MMAGHDRVGRQTPSERQRLLRSQRAPARTAESPPTSSAMRRKQSHVPGSFTGGTAPPRSSRFPSERSLPAEIDDDEAETRLFRPKIDSSQPTQRERPSSKGPSERTSRTSRAMSRPGALIMIPAEVPSVRVRSDSDIELMEGAAQAPDMTFGRRRLSSSFFIVCASIAVLMLVTHELALVLRLPWLDVQHLLVKLAKH